MLTHTVSNQSKALVDYDLFNSDAPLVESIVAHGASGFSDKLTAFGRFTGSSAAIALGQATPILRSSAPTTVLAIASIALIFTLPIMT